jgi:microcystin-dependent protein
MADPFVSEIRIFGFNFAPTGWAKCDGQLMPISQNTALFSLLGTTYGGDGRSTFALPDLQGRAPMQPGQGQGLTSRDLGESGGSDSVTLLGSELPAHEHQTVQASGQPGNTSSPAGGVYARVFGGGTAYADGAPDAQMADQGIMPSGGSSPHTNMQPYLTMNFCIALQGIFPARP